MASNRQDDLDKMELDQPFPLFNLPTELRQHIYSFLPPDRLRFFSVTCQVARAETARLRLISLLLHYAAHAKPVSYDQLDKSKLAVDEILKVYPDLLFVKGFTQDPAGNIIYGSAYQIALATGDIWMLKMMKELFPRIKDAEVIAKKQEEEQFPDGSRHDARNLAQIAQLKEDLKEIVAAISDDPCADGKATKRKTVDAIKKLKEHLAPKKGEMIKTGMHSPPEILRIIHAVYDQKWNQWLGDRLALYSREVIGSAERRATAVDAQRYKKGLRNYDNEKSPPDRTDSYFHVAGQSIEGLGSSYFYDVFLGGLAIAGREGWGAPEGGLAKLALDKLCGAKISGPDELSSNCDTLDRTLKEEVKPRSLNSC